MNELIAKMERRLGLIRDERDRKNVEYAKTVTEFSEQVRKLEVIKDRRNDLLDDIIKIDDKIRDEEEFLRRMTELANGMENTRS